LRSLIAARSLICYTGAGSASRMLLYLSCPDLKPGEAESSLHQLNIERRHVNLEQLLVEGIIIIIIIIIIIYSP